MSGAGNTLRVDLQVAAGDEREARRLLETWCIEQSIEVSPAVVDSEVRERMVGRIASLERLGERERIEATGDGDGTKGGEGGGLAIEGGGVVEGSENGRFAASLTFDMALIGQSASQFLSLLYGNGSLLEGFRVTGCDWDVLHAAGIVEGPAFGVEGVRRLCGGEAGSEAVARRALTCTALKPIGYGAKRLAAIAGEFAAGGIDIIKDDHGLFDQPSAPFAERVARCVEAVGEANARKKGGGMVAEAGSNRGLAAGGRRTLYFPNVTGDGSQTLEQFEAAVELGADGVLLIPHLCGLPTMREIARTRRVPVMAHPAFSGSYVRNRRNGFPASFLYGELWRAFGADLAVYPNAGGRFPLTEAECLDLHGAALDRRLPFLPSFPTPGGGIRRETVGRWVRTYGHETVFLIGGSLYEHPGGISAACRELSEAIGQASDDGQEAHYT